MAGCIVQRDQMKPAADGTIIFLNADGQLDAAVDRGQGDGFKGAGSAHGDPRRLRLLRLHQDSEGNHVGLHSRGD